MTLLSRLFSNRPSSSRKFRTLLGVEELGLRAMPDGSQFDPPNTNPGISNPGQTAPVIDDFGVSEIAHGWLKFEGHVTAANSEGLTVYFSGIPALTDMTATTDENGDFVLVVQVQTNGTDSGTVSVQTVDANGVWSNIAMVPVSPTP
jgi:hypothetical protein